MTKDVIALTPRMPDTRSIINALMAAGPDLRLQSIADGAVLQLCDDGGRPLISVEAPILIQVPGETTRLLGTDVACTSIPIWWVEARASTAVDEAGRAAATFASHLADHLDGTVWPPDTALPPQALTPVDAKTTSAPTPAAVQPAVDVLTDRAAVVIQDRPVVPMSSWLSDTFRSCLVSNRALQIVTPPSTRLSLPTRTALMGPPNRWVVRNPAGGYYDGLFGTELHWHDGAFTPVGNPPGEVPVARAFCDVDVTADSQLLLSLRTCHPADEQLLLGGGLETAWRTLTGTPPSGWATAEPANLPWSRPDITRLARRRVPDGTWIVAVGTPDRPAIATMRIARTTAGVEEDVTIALGYAEGEQPPFDRLPDLAAQLATEHNLHSLLAQRRAARRDLTAPGHFEDLPIPLAFAIGPKPVQEVGFHHARHAPVPVAVQVLGCAELPGLYYPLSESPSVSSWTALQQLMRHLRPANETQGR
ncbi:DUF6177 family protein [Streptantibioticus ferralitis]|uniref:DUF6177 family protein n=1 Tax=Streptantibioticus ferralitis TaxID=236510 RepID=A0ABT5Z1E7_9ACTN|nr:DUF6177 family protein [Streptantibioticus ferralitis]MDF2257650.1 DUF6177 family protein [Streptantibioticus ferralitis]